jgi:Cof subfamily protein (haloacid dehalogenase superfamily)
VPSLVSRDRYDAFLLDLDGTLLDGVGTLTRGGRDAVRRLVDLGYVVVLATGRSPSGTRDVHEALGLETDACCYNGAWIGPPRGGAPFHYAPIPDDHVPHVVGVEARARFAFRHRGDHKYTARIADAEHRRVASWYTNVVEVNGDGSTMPGADLIRVSAFFEGEEETRAAWDALPEAAKTTLHRESFPLAMFPGFEDMRLHLCEVQRKGRGKAEALRYLAERHGVAAERVVAVGDQHNDVPLLRDAGLAVAMANSVPRVLEVADLVIGHHREDALPRWLDASVGP